jgi:hypothetical protein
MSVYDPSESDYELHCADARKEQEAFAAEMTAESWEEAEPAIIAADKREGLAHRISRNSWLGPEGDKWIENGGTKD